MPKESKTNTADSKPPEKQEVREIPLGSLNMKQLIELDACTRCGECLTWCPVYDQDAKEALIPRRKVIDFLKIAKTQHGLIAKIMKSEKLSSPLKAVLGRILGYRRIGRQEIDDFVQNLYECSTCGQCEVVCPAHIETVTLWEELRRVIVQAGYGPLEVQQALVKSVKAFDNPWQQPRAARTKWARKAKKEGLIANLPREIKKTQGKVLLFLGCTAAYDVNVKQVAINNINILEALGIDYGILGSEEKCCASVLLRMGDPEHKRVFKENIDLFNSLGIETLISSCSGCFKTIMQDYPKIAPLNFEVLHSVEFIARMLKQGTLTFPHPVNRTVTYHDPCHLGRATGGFEAPRMIMEAIPGLKLLEMPRNREYSRCCGAGGGLKAGFPDIQTKMAQRRIQEAEETGAEQLVSCCPFCYQGLNVGITALESQIVMRDISALVAESLLGCDVFERAAQKAASSVEDKKARQAARKESRTQKKTARQVAKIESPSESEESESGAAISASSTPKPQGKVEDPKAMIKAEREKKRAEKRAARDKEKALRSNGPAPAQVPAAATEPAARAPRDDISDEAELTTAKNKSVADTAASDSKTEKERKRAEKRELREKEKAARRAAREK
jgi:heterodisulfide reductase subunit D